MCVNDSAFVCFSFLIKPNVARLWCSYQFSSHGLEVLTGHVAGIFVKLG